jgi:hypothetical protein
LLRRCGEVVRSYVAKVPELGVVDRHGLLLAEAAQRLAVLLGEAAALLKRAHDRLPADRARGPDA